MIDSFGPLVLQDIQNALLIPSVEWLVFDDYGVSYDVRRAVEDFVKQGRLVCEWGLGVTPDEPCEWMCNRKEGVCNSLQGVYGGPEGIACKVVKGAELRKEGDDETTTTASPVAVAQGLQNVMFGLVDDWTFSGQKNHNYFGAIMFRSGLG